MVKVTAANTFISIVFRCAAVCLFGSSSTSTVLPIHYSAVTTVLCATSTPNTCASVVVLLYVAKYTVRAPPVAQCLYTRYHSHMHTNKT
jgi:hypothetical protein